MEKKKIDIVEELKNGMEVLLTIEIFKDFIKEMEIPDRQIMHCMCILLIETARKNELSKPHLLRNVSILWEAIDGAMDE